MLLKLDVVTVEHTKAMQKTARHNAIVMSTSFTKLGYSAVSSSSALAVSVLAPSVVTAISFDSLDSELSIAVSLTVGSTAIAAFSDIPATPAGANVEWDELSLDDLLDGRGVASSGTPMMGEFEAWKKT
jgi:hypothetical protein